MDIDEFEERRESLIDDSLSFARRLFVEDGCLGGNRDAELRVRVITDCPATALGMRSLLHRTPLYDPEVFPRTLTVYVATAVVGAIEAGRLSSAQAGTPPGAPAPSPDAPVAPYTVVDVDPVTARGTVLAAGDVDMASLKAAISRAAAGLMAAGGYRSVPGGDHVPSLAGARADGVLDWYLKDGHVVAAPNAPHPDLLLLAGADVVLPVDGGAPTVVVGGTGALAGAAAAAGRLYAAGGAVWHPSALTSLWAGVSTPSALTGGSAPLPLPRGALVAHGRAHLPLSGPKGVPAPARVVVIAAGGGDVATPSAAARVVAGVAGVAGKGVDKLTARLAGVEVKVVGTEAEAVALLGLAPTVPKVEAAKVEAAKPKAPAEAAPKAAATPKPAAAAKPAAKK